MATEVKNNAMKVSVAELAKKHGVVPGQVVGVLAEFGISVDHDSFEAEKDELDLIAESLAEAKGLNEIVLPANPTPRDIAFALGKPQPEIQKTLMLKMKVMAQLTTSLEHDVAEKLVDQFGYKLKVATAPKPKQAVAKPAAAETGAPLRPPVVTILGHVDHGKTSLLDYIRKANIADKEFGGITQHIGAYQAKVGEGLITFLDTPGHEAFTAMRARGAQITDIAVLVVASDDGIMPQTREAIGHVKNAGVPMIVAINKIDMPQADPNKVIVQLAQYEVIAESLGGQVATFPVSAHTGQGINDLLEGILLQAEIMELKADPKADLRGIVIEAKLEKGRGVVATVLVQAGTLKVGDVLVVGNTYGRIKAMHDYTGARVQTAGPSMPVEILGLSDVPGAGDTVERTETDREARLIAEGRQQKERDRLISGTPVKRRSLRDLKKQMEGGELRELNLVVKADVQGSVEAVRGLLDRVENEEVEAKVIYSGVGTISESDILLASAADAIVVGFNVKPEPGAKREAERHKIEIRTYNIIYELIEDIEAAIKGMLEPKFEEEYLGTVEVRAVFKLTKAGKVAGCHVTDGKILRNSRVRVKRGRDIVWEGEVDSLKNVKQDAREMSAGQDCGIQLKGWEDYKEGDIIEAFQMVQVN